MTLRHRRRARWFVVLMLTVMGALGLTGTAAAHTDLVSSDPADGTILAQVPTSITLTFNEPVQNFEPVVVITGPDGQSYPVSPPVVDSAVVRTDVTALGPPGSYTIAYRVVSVDGHPVTGQLQFELAAPAPAAAPAAAIPSTSPTADPGTTPPTTASPTRTTASASEPQSVSSASGTTTSAGTVSTATEPAGGSRKIPTWVWVVGGAVIIAVLIVVQQRRERSRR